MPTSVHLLTEIETSIAPGMGATLGGPAIKCYHFQHSTKGRRYSVSRSSLVIVTMSEGIRFVFFT